MNSKHPVTIVWSEEDQVFLASVPQLAGCIAHGETREEAVINLEAVIHAWLAFMQEKGHPVPAEKCTDAQADAFMSEAV